MSAGSIMSDESESDDYLFHAANAVMAVILGLMIEKMGAGVASAFEHARRVDLALAAPLLIEGTVFLTGVCVLATLAHLHRGAGLRYRRHYFFMDLMAGPLFLYVAFACVHESAFNHLHEQRLAQGAPAVDVDLVRKGLAVLSGAFVLLVIRALMAYATIPRPEERRKVLWVVPFHLSGIGLSVVATAWPKMILAFSLTGTAGALLYLALFWVMRLKITVT